MTHLNQHPTFLALCDAVDTLKHSDTLTVTEQLDALDTVVHKAAGSSSMLAAAYPDEVTARLSRLIKSNDVGGEVIFEDDGPGAA